MNQHFDKETLEETLTYIEQNCKNLNDAMIYVSKRFEHYLQAAKYAKYKTLFDIYRYIKHSCKELMAVENVKDYLQSQNPKSWTK